VSHWIVRARVLRVVGLVVWALAAAPAEAGPQRLVILPVVVHTASPDPAYVSQGISDMLSARLEQLGGVEVLRVDDPAVATSRIEPALALGRRLRADYVVFGSFTQFGDGASLDIQCAAVDDRAAELERNIFIQSGTVGEIIPQLDQLADKIVRFVRGKGTSEEPGAVANVGSRTLQGFEERLEALEIAIFGGVEQVVVDAAVEEQVFEDVEQAEIDDEAEEAETGTVLEEVEVEEVLSEP